jgi:rhomboid protease GluP
MADPDDRIRDLNASPLNPLPGAVWLLLLAVAGAEVVLLAATAGWIGGPSAIGWRLEAIQRFAFSGAIQEWMTDNARAPLRHLLRYVTYPFVQAGPMPAVFVLAMLAGLGKAVGDGLGPVRLLVAALLPPIVAAVVFGLILGGHELAWLIGAWPMVFGLVGAYTWMLWERAGGDGARQRRAFGLIGVLMLARLGFGLLAETGHGWIADLVAFGVGLGLAAITRPGSWTRLRSLVRHR